MTRVARPTACRRGIALLVTMLTLALLVAVVSELVTATSVDSIQTSRRGNTLQHRLAVDSTLRLLEAEVAVSDRLQTELDRLGYATIEATLGECQVRGTVTDDGAKLDVTAFSTESQRRLLTAKLNALARRYDLPEVDIRLRPVCKNDDRGVREYYWFDQLFADPSPGAFFYAGDGVDSGRTGVVPAAWSDVVTVFGSGRIDLRRVLPEVLDIALADLDRGLGRRIVSQRDQAKERTDFLTGVLAGMEGAVREQVAGRLAGDLHRYALTIETAIGGDRRLWYVVATIQDGTTQVHYRGQIQW